MRSRRGAVLIVTLLAVLTLSACSQVPVTGRWRLMLVSRSETQQLGAKAWEDVLSQATVSNDEQMNRILLRVADRIIEHAHVPDAEWDVRLIRSDQVNAFALPGGKVAIYTGILPICRDEAGLAAVVGHEVAHVIARHGGERMSLGVAVQLALTGASAATQEWSPALREAVMAAMGLGANVGVMLPYSRTHENEADLIGTRLMAMAGYNPEAAPRVWKHMAEASQGAPPEFLSTHPASENRMKTLEEMLPEMRELYRKAPEQYGYGVALPSVN